MSGEGDMQDRIHRLRTGPAMWEEPTCFDLSDSSHQLRVDELQREGLIREVYDPAISIADDLFSIRHPEALSDASQREEYIKSQLDKRHEFGRWFYFPWDGSLTRYPERVDHFDLRTARNRNLVTEEEQRRIGLATIAVYGLSVGRLVTETLVMSGIGSKYILGDFDTVSPTNLNRMSATMQDVGGFKVDNLAKRISKVDPYIEQVHDRSGFSDGSMGLLDAHSPSLVVEEVDQLGAKVGLREYARSRAIPLVMATDLGSRAIVDTEIYGSRGVRPFLGRVPSSLYGRLLEGTANEVQKREALMRIVGPFNLSTRMIDSAMEVGETISGNPQLGRVAMVGAALAAETVEEILLGRRLKSGSKKVSIRDVLGLTSRTGVLELMRVWRRVPGYMGFRR